MKNYSIPEIEWWVRKKTMQWIQGDQYLTICCTSQLLLLFFLTYCILCFNQVLGVNTRCYQQQKIREQVAFSGLHFWVQANVKGQWNRKQLVRCFQVRKEKGEIETRTFGRCASESASSLLVGLENSKEQVRFVKQPYGTYLNPYLIQESLNARQHCIHFLLRP